MAVTSNDAGMKALRKEFAYLRANHTRIGVLSGPAKGGNVQGTAAKKKPSIGGRRKRRGHSLGGPNLTVAEVFNFHENGLRGELGPGHNHKRSSIGWVEENKREEIRGFLVKVMDLVVQGRMNGRDALFFAGEKAQSLIKARIVSGIPPALNPEYLKFKSHAGGKAKPLIWTGQLLNSVRYQVVKSL